MSEDLSEFDPLAPLPVKRSSRQPKKVDKIPEQKVEPPPESSDPIQESLPSGNAVEPTEQPEPSQTKPDSQPESNQQDESTNKESEPLTRIPSSSGKPVAEEDKPFDFQEFLNQMRTKQADPIARYVKSFLNEFLKKNWTAKEQVKIITDFETFIRAKMRECPPFATMNESDWQNSQEGIEKLIMNRLYVRTFSPRMAPALRRNDHEEDLLRDKVLAEKLRVWHWVEPRHLDIDAASLPDNQRLFVELACKELNKVNHYRAPRDKVICILNCSKVIWALIRQAKLESNADSFLPLLIYVVLQARPTFLISNLNYINRFRGNIHGETAYYLSMAASAVAFIEGLDKSSLTIGDEEYEEKIEAAVKQAREESAEAEDPALDDSLARESSATPSSVFSTSAGLFMDSLKSYANKIFEPDDVETPPRSSTPQPSQHSRQPSQDPQELAAKQASAEDYRAQKIQEQEFSQVSKTLREMFPTLDKEVIDDVLTEKGVRIGAAIDVCLALVGEE